MPLPSNAGLPFSGDGAAAAATAAAALTLLRPRLLLLLLPALIATNARIICLQPSGLPSQQVHLDHHGSSRKSILLPATNLIIQIIIISDLHTHLSS